MSKSYYIIPVFISHQGCPHQCVFCNQDRIAGKYEEVFASDVRKIIDEYLSTINSKDATIEVSFFGGTFTAINVNKQKELLEVAREYKERGLIHKIRLSTRPDAILPYILGYLKEYKVDIIELGVQSLDDEVLRKAGRGHSVSDVEAASKLTVAAAECPEKALYAIQFHPEVLHTIEGSKILFNFVRDICGCAGDWRMDSFVEENIASIRRKVGKGRVLCALSGGVDSSVAAVLLSKAVGEQLTCVFVDHGLLRKNEGDESAGSPLRL